MFNMNKIAILLTALLVATITSAADVFIQQNCNFPVYVREGIGSDAYTDFRLLPPGTHYRVTKQPVNGGPGLTMLLTREEVDKPVYQWEAAKGDDGNIYFNMSQVDGNPFGDIFRGVYGGNCARHECQPGQTSDECGLGGFKVMGAPQSCGDAVLVLC
ncbi:hypothetical protein EJ08DRAFT_656394 [Tothia fuscella]|uniref:Uncharacterized protein n=1 Tax=Tothia fuscella TaxID=1048955 RepID=A0A9P4U3X0_9PEZI|nr:hypothetical protein EJ08DRAFT_656394 [Tothia fuscella]